MIRAENTRDRRPERPWQSIMSMPQDSPQAPPVTEKAIPALSVVIPSCNGERHIPACLDSLERQTFRDYEVIVVENGSEDRTVEIVERNYPWVTLISLGRKQGFSRPVNIGWRRARADLIFLLNDDTVCADDCLERLVEAAAEAPETAFFAALMVFYDNPSAINSAGHRLQAEATVVEAGSGEPPGGYYGQEREVFGACAGAALYRRSLLEALDGLDEDFWIINEDVDFDFRAQLAGESCRFIPGAVVQHRVSQFMGVGSPRMVHAYTKNFAAYLLKDIPPVFWARHRRRILMHQWRASSALVREGRFGALLRARWDLIWLAPRMLRKRRARMAELIGRGQRIVEWAERDRGPEPSGQPDSGRSPVQRLWHNFLPGAVALVLMAPLLFWLGVMAVQDRLLARGVEPVR